MLEAQLKVTCLLGIELDLKLLDNLYVISDV